MNVPGLTIPEKGVVFGDFDKYFRTGDEASVKKYGIVETKDVLSLLVRDRGFGNHSGAEKWLYKLEKSQEKKSFVLNFIMTVFGALIGAFLIKLFMP